MARPLKQEQCWSGEKTHEQTRTNNFPRPLGRQAKNTSTSPNLDLRPIAAQSPCKEPPWSTAEARTSTDNPCGAARHCTAAAEARFRQPRHGIAARRTAPVQQTKDEHRAALPPAPARMSLWRRRDEQRRRPRPGSFIWRRALAGLPARKSARPVAPGRPAEAVAVADAADDGHGRRQRPQGPGAQAARRDEAVPAAGVRRHDIAA